MPAKLILVGDVNLMNVDDARVPFARVGAELRAAEIAFANLECCLYDPPPGHTVEQEGFFADPEIAGEALREAGIAAVGIANNVNYGAAPILGSIERLDRLGIAHTGAGGTLAAARMPAVVERSGRRFGFLQRSSVYWPTNHEASARGPGIAALRAHTAYQVPAHKTRPEIPPMNRPGIPPIILTWPDPAYLISFTADIAALRETADIVVASCHWGLGEEVLDYMRTIAHAAIDAGADVVIGHGPHHSLPIEIYNGRPVFYGLGSFSFHTGHGGLRHGDWVGMMVELSLGPAGIAAAGFRFVRHNAANETVLRPPQEERAALDRIGGQSLGARLEIGEEAVRIRW